MQRPQRLMTPVLAAVFAALALGACSRSDDRTAGQRVDDAVARVEQKADEMKRDTEQAMERGKQEAREAAAEMKDATRDAKAEASDKVADATITTTVNAELAKDDKLSALKIDVDTSNGHVALKGTAPDVVSKERATQLASAVKGVVSVDNQLRVANM